MAGREAAHWKIEDLDFSRIARGEVRQDDNLFYLVACASLIESGSDLYTQNLVDFFQGDDEVTAWLSRYWEAEELQHGQALRAYVSYVWPEFDWETAYGGFLEEYATLCKVDLLSPTRGLELAARCVVETGTASYYRALARATDEPVLRDLASRIATDEVSHYKHFYRFFRRYRQEERLGRLRVLGIIGRRTLELKSEDADCAVRHVVRTRSPERAGDAAYVRQLSARINGTVRTNLSPGATLKMLMRPLELPARVETVIQYPIRQFMEHVFLR